jgi:type IX secretion system PorP/SprF family membrane protein
MINLLSKKRSMKKIIIVAVFVLSLLGGEVYAQQTPLYSQYMFNMMNINPAYTGNREAKNLTLLMRSQWMDMPGAPQTGSVTYDDRINDRNYSWGAQMYYDKLGIERTTGFQGFYSYSAPFEHATLTLGLSFGALNYNIDYRRTNPYDAGDPSLQAVINKFLPTAGVGALLAGERWYVGLSTPALLKTKISSNGDAVIKQAGSEGHYFLTGGYIIPINSDVVVKPSVLLKYVKGVPIHTDFNANVWIKDVIGIGASYRVDDAVVGLLEVRLRENFRLGYSYDYNISDLRYYSGGTHEFMFRYELGKKKSNKVVSPRYF